MKYIYLFFLLLSIYFQSFGQICILSTYNMRTDYYKYISDSNYLRGYSILCIDGHEDIADSVFAIELTQGELHDSTGKYIIDNCVPFISKSIGLYKNLYYIDFSNCRDKYSEPLRFPEVIGKLTNIEEIRFGRFECDDKTFPESMKNLNRLKSLGFKATFSKVPQFIYGLDSIEALWFNFEYMKKKLTEDFTTCVVKLLEVPSLTIVVLENLNLPRSEIEKIKAAFSKSKIKIIIRRGATKKKDFELYKSIAPEYR